MVFYELCVAVQRCEVFMLRTRVLAIFFLSLVGGTLAWQVTVQGDPLVPLPQELAKPGAAEQTPELLALKLRNELQNDCAGLAVFAAVAVGLGGYFFSRGKKQPSRIGIATTGLLIGIATGILMALSSNFLRDLLPIHWLPSTKATTIWSVLFLELSIACALVASFGLGFDRHSGKMWAGAVVGALLAAVSYPLVVGTLFQFENSDPALPLGTYSRAILFCLPTFLIFALMEYQYSSSIGKPVELTESSTV